VRRVACIFPLRSTKRDRYEPKGPKGGQKIHARISGTPRVSVQEAGRSSELDTRPPPVPRPPRSHPLSSLTLVTAANFVHALQMSPLEGWEWRGRTGSGVVKRVEGLGMLQHLRDSRLIPYRLGCNCLYEHPGLRHLLVGQEGRHVIGDTLFLASCLKGLAWWFNVKLRQ